LGIFDRFRASAQRKKIYTESVDKVRQKEIVGATKDDAPEVFQSYTNSNITFSGNLSGYDYDSILRDKQGNIVSLYELADYYTDADAIIKGIVHHVFVPFSTCSDWFLVGKNEKTIKLYEDQYKRMRLKEKLDGIMLEYWKYSNVVCYIFDGQLITLPIHKCKIGNMMFNGMPLVDFDCLSIENEWRAKGYSVEEGWIKDNSLEEYFKGYPEEVKKAIDKGAQYAQLNPANTFVMQSSHEGWNRYAIPFIAAALEPLSRKELIANYEKATLNLAAHGFTHAQYGDPTKGYDMLPDVNQLRQVANIFKQGMTGFPLAVTNHLATAKFVQADTDDLFQWDKYRDVNNDILSAGGVSGIIVSGVSQDGSTFASAQISMQTAESRINAARDKFCELMNRVNERLTEIIPGTYNLKEIPEFKFMPLSMEGKKALRETCEQLWMQGNVSTRTYMETSGYNIDKEVERRKEEAKEIDSILVSREGNTNNTENNDGAGRPEMDDSERTSDPEKSETGKQPKPSSPDGSMDE
jgi:hypothetical protein